MTETRPIAAALLVTAAMAVIGYIDNYVVVIAEDASVWQFHFTRALMALPFFGLAIWLGLGAARPSRWIGVIGRSAMVACAMILYFSSLSVLPIAKAAAGFFTAPIFVVLIEVLVMGRRIGPIRIGAVVLGFLGILLVLRPEPGLSSAWVFVPVLGGFFYALSAIATRSWCAGESTLTLLMGAFIGLGLVGAGGLTLFSLVPGLADPTGSSFVLRGWESPTPTFLFWTFVQAVGSLIAVAWLIRGYQLGEASYVAIFEYTLLVFVSAWAYLLRGETVDLIAAMGIALIVTSGVVIALRSEQSGVAPGT